MKKKIYPTEVLEVEVMGLDSQGMGVVEYWHPPLKEGCPRKKLKLTIPQALPGDVVRVTVPNAKGRRRVTVSYDEIVKASKDRIGFPLRMSRLQEEPHFFICLMQHNWTIKNALFNLFLKRRGLILEKSDLF